MISMKEFKVIEAFSGIGSQAKAIKKANLSHWEIINTIEWDVNALIAYFFIHHQDVNYQHYKNLEDDKLNEIIDKYDLSMDGKTPMSTMQRKRLSREIKWRLAAAIEHSNNLGSIENLKGEDLQEDFDLLTYSFPCQDLSIAGVWHGLNSGISKDIVNRSGMLWQVERILLEKYNGKSKLPKFLLMENVVNILSKKHIGDFQMWQKNLETMGYVNQVFRLNASSFGVPQNRERVFMISVYVGENVELRGCVRDFFNHNDLRETLTSDFQPAINSSIEHYLRMDYSINKYKEEADASQPNDTPSRKKIWNDNLKIFDNNAMYTSKLIPTITTKQDRNPNSGVIYYENLGKEGKAPFRYLTPRECFILMGFDESDYEALIDNNFKVNKGREFFTPAKLIKMAGNSIVVDVLEEVFLMIDRIQRIVENYSYEPEYCYKQILSM